MPWRQIGEWRYSSTILDLGTRWISFTPQLLYPRYLLDRRLSGPQGLSGRYGGEKILVFARTWTPAVQLVTRRYIDWAISALRVSFFINVIDWEDWSVPICTLYSTVLDFNFFQICCSDWYLWFSCGLFKDGNLKHIWIIYSTWWNKRKDGCGWIAG
jgi:hypothetical protein